MDDREFFDHLFQMWSKTTWAKDRYWDYNRDQMTGLYKIDSVGERDERGNVAYGLYEADADWITAVHGCFPDLIRRLHSALDEADTADQNRDSRECRIAELELELIDMKTIIQNLSNDPPWHQRSE